MKASAVLPLALGVTGVLGLVACGGGGGASRGASRPASPPVFFDFAALDGTHVSSETTRGRVTVVAFITTYDLPSQVLVRELSDLVRRHKPRINALGVVLEPPKNAPLVETFAEALELGFTVTLADAATLEQRGPFGTITGVPTLVVLGPDGTERVRREGAPSPAELERAVDTP
ncbi:MAG TPA: TlpA family protein disulfide reductase [Polyangiaceae bacterium]|nr:TlpA family protein disulfide reductase [Polyangiaceae bacterium]